MSDINEFDVSTNTYTLRSYTQAEIDANAIFDAIPKTPEIISGPLDVIQEQLEKKSNESLTYATSQSGTSYTLSADNLSI